MSMAQTHILSYPYEGRVPCKWAGCKISTKYGTKKKISTDKYYYCYYYIRFKIFT